jgi:hypothetical protein
VSKYSAWHNSTHAAVPGFSYGLQREGYERFGHFARAILLACAKDVVFVFVVFDQACDRSLQLGLEHLWRGRHV